MVNERLEGALCVWCVRLSQEVCERGCVLSSRARCYYSFNPESSEEAWLPQKCRPLPNEAAASAVVPLRRSPQA